MVKRYARRHPLPFIAAPPNMHVQTRLEGELAEAFSEYQNELGLSRSDTARVALTQFLAATGYLAQPQTPSQEE